MLSNNEFIPLATRMRPGCLEEFVGQSHLLGKDKPLFCAIEKGKLHSMILWGPPGSGKTTLAEIIAQKASERVESISAVLAGVKDIREVVERAERHKGQATILFVDEVHRFNKSQQDAFLPHVEKGTITLIGATTENPSFQLNNALLSRTRVYVLKQLTEADLLSILENALANEERGLGKKALEIPEPLCRRIVQFADGDARQCLNLLEIIADFALEENGRFVVDDGFIDKVLTEGLRRFDKRGEAFYDQIPALHKSVRGSDPDASLYWLSRLLDGGCDLFYVARWVVRMASEDIENADPRALQLALDAWETFERLGTPEGELAIAQAVVYCACAAKSNVVYKAFNATSREVKSTGNLEVPLYLRNVPTRLMKSLDYGKDYRYAHDEPDSFAAGVDYLLESLVGRWYYFSVNRGLEIKIKEKLEYYRKLNEQHKTTEDSKN